jgi:ribosomal protein S16
MRWLNNGALPTERVRKLLEINGVWAEFMATKSTAKKK